MTKAYDEWEVAKPLPTPLLYRHAPKAVKRGHPADRIFLVVGRWKNGELLAWKCEQLPNGKVRHPARWTKPMTLKELVAYGSMRSGNNGAAPTAIFKPDSFYVKINA